MEPSMGMSMSTIVGLCVLAFLLGRAIQKWSDGTMEAEEGAYRLGYEEGARDANPHG